MEIKEEVRQATEELVALRRDFHSHPELGFREERTAGIVERYLKDLGLRVRRCAGTGVIGVLEGALPGRTLLLQKTVPLNANEIITFAIVNNATTGALELVRVSDSACSAQLGGLSCLRMANFVLGDNALDLLLGDGRVLFSDVRYKENTIARRLRPGYFQFYVTNTPLRIEPRVADIEMDSSSRTLDGSYIPGYGEVDVVTSFGLRARRGVMYTAYVIGQANTDEVQVVVAENR